MLQDHLLKYHTFFFLYFFIFLISTWFPLCQLTEDLTSFILRNKLIRRGICLQSKNQPQTEKVIKMELDLGSLHLFLLNLLGWHWQITLYRFQVYNSIMYHLYTVLCVQHSKSSLLPSLFITPLLSPTCIQFPFPSGNQHICLCLWGFVVCLIHSFFHPIPQPLSPLTTVSLFSMSLFLICLLFYLVY